MHFLNKLLRYITPWSATGACRSAESSSTIPRSRTALLLRSYPCCQVMSRLKILIKTHPFTCASYNPFESLHIDHIGPLPVDDKGNSHILVMIDEFSRWVELFPTKTTGASEAAGCIVQHFGRFETPDVIHTDQGPELSQHSFATAYSKEENGLVKRVNQEVMRHLRAMLFDTRMHDKWPYEQLPMVQRIMNTIDDPPCNSTSDGLDSTILATAGNRTRLDKLHDYLRANVMKTLIPREHK